MSVAMMLGSECRCCSVMVDALTACVKELLRLLKETKLENDRKDEQEKRAKKAAHTTTGLIKMMLTCMRSAEKKKDRWPDPTTY